MRARPQRRSLLHLVTALVVGGLIVVVLVLREDPTPVVAGDSLVSQASAPHGAGLPEARVIEGVGHDLCQDRDEIERAGRRHPRRIVLAYTGNAISDRVRAAVDEFGVQGLGLVYASCLREVRKRVPESVQLVVVQPLACGPGDLHGSPVLGAYLRTATIGGTYPAGIVVPPMPNASYSTAVDDRLTPGHRYRDSDGGGVLRTDDRLHLTAHGARVYAEVLRRLAATGT
jgi:hypothetical protein